MRLTAWPATERPREKLLQLGPQSLSDAELLAIFIRSGTAGKTAVDVARECLTQYPNLNQLLNAPAAEFCQIKGLGMTKYVELQAAMELGQRTLSTTLTQRDLLSSPAETQSFLSMKLKNRPHEVFACLFLDNKHRLLEYQELFRGTIDGASVYVREVVKETLEHNAAAVILCHNHPSGAAEPSQADIRITRRLSAALDLIDVRVLDHIVIGDGECVSFAEQGLL